MKEKEEFPRMPAGEKLSSPVVDAAYGATSVVSAEIAVVVRELYAQGEIVPNIAFDMQLSEETVEACLDGKYWAYSGGALRPFAAQGLCKSRAVTANQGKFVCGAWDIARKILSPEEMLIVGNFNGLSPGKVTRTLKFVEKELDYDRCLARYRGVLKLHATKSSAVEYAVLDYAALAGKRKRKPE